MGKQFPEVNDVVFISKKNYFRLFYEGFFGTVYAMTVDQYQKINGHANTFWGWGGEDNDCLNRFIILSEFNFLDLKMFEMCFYRIYVMLFIWC